MCAIIPVIASKTPRCSRVSRRFRSQHVSANRCSLFPRRGGLPSLITMVVSPPSVRRPSPPVTRPTRRPSRSLVTSRPWRASRDRPLRRPSRHAAAPPARTVGHARAVRARGLPAPPRRSRRRRSALSGWAADAIPAVHHVEAMLPTRREDWYTRTSRVVMRGNTPWCWPFRSPVLCPVSGARRGAGAPAQRIDSRCARRVTRRSTPSLPRMLLR